MFVGDFTAAAAELDEDPDTFGFAGREYRIAPSVGLMPLMQFAAIAKTGVDSRSLDGLAAMYELLRACVAEDDWPDFEQACVQHRVDADGYMLLVRALIEAISGRPTRRPSGSPAGPSSTSESSKGDSSSQAMDGFTPVDDLLAAHQ